MSQQIVITGTDENGNEITETIIAPDIGEQSTSTKLFHKVKYMEWKWEDEKGKIHIEYEPPRGWKWVERKLWNLRCRLYWLFHKHDDGGEDSE